VNVLHYFLFASHAATVNCFFPAGGMKTAEVQWPQPWAAYSMWHVSSRDFLVPG